MEFDVPILVIIFNRSDFTRLIFNVLCDIKPLKLYVVSDGARNEKESIEVNRSRDIFNNINWKCNVKYNYSDRNLGIRKRIESGISWVFEHEEKLIIIEDDCISTTDFFVFCQKMLEKYKDDKKIMSINGCNLNPNITKGIKDSYLFTRYANPWGWATWKRAWELYDSELSGITDNNIRKIFKNIFSAGYRASCYWYHIMKRVQKQKIDSWAYRWMFSLWINNGLAIVPKINLINNIGIDKRSSNTKCRYEYLNLETEKFDFYSFKHPEFVMQDINYDKWLENSVYSKSFTQRMKWFKRKLFSRE